MRRGGGKSRVESSRTSEVGATPLPPQPAGADAPRGPGTRPAFPQSGGLSGWDLRPGGLSAGLVTGSPGALSQPPRPGRVLGWLPAPGQAVGPGHLGKMSLGPEVTSGTPNRGRGGRGEASWATPGRGPSSRAACPQREAAGGWAPGTGPLVSCWQQALAWATSQGGSGTGVGWGRACSFTDSCLSPGRAPHGDSIALPEPGRVRPVRRDRGPPGTRVRGSG